MPTTKNGSMSLMPNILTFAFCIIYYESGKKEKFKQVLQEALPGVPENIFLLEKFTLLIKEHFFRNIYKII